MKVIQIIDSLNVGGAEVLAVNIANSLAEDGIDSFLCASRKEGNLKNIINKRVKYLFLERNKTFDISAILKLKNFIKKNEIQIIHAHSTSSFLAFCVKLIFPKIKIVWHNHTGAYVNLSGKKLIILKIYSKYISYIISVNKELDVWSKNVLKHKNGSYIPNFPSFSNSKKETTLNGVSGKRIVCLAGLKEVKDHLNLLKAFLLFRKLNKNWTLHLVGKDFKDEYSERIKNFINKNNLVKHVFILGEQSDIKYILSQCNIGVLSSKSEGLPVSILEYGLSKLPVVVTNVGECKVVVKHNLTGFVVPKENPKLLSEKLCILAVLDKKRIDFGIENFENILKNYSKKSFIEQLLNIYKTQLD